MSDYLKKLEDNEFTPVIDAGIAKILTLCSIVNRKTEMCCMIRDSSHCRSLEIDVYPTSASVTDRVTAPVKFSLGYENTPINPDNQYRIESIERFTCFLETCLNEREIPYKMLCEVMHEVVKHYEV